MRRSQASWLASIPDKFGIVSLTRSAQMRSLRCCMTGRSGLAQINFRRVSQWRVWLLLAGRGFGKTRTGAELIDRQLLGDGRAGSAGRTYCCRRARRHGGGRERHLGNFAPLGSPALRAFQERLTWHNGAIATYYSADEPERLRGPQHDMAWCDELTSWRHPEAWDMLMFGLRLGDDPRVIVTTTPRPMPLLRALLKDPAVAVTRGTTYQNRANLAPEFLDQIVRKYEGTRLGRQEDRG